MRVVLTLLLTLAVSWEAPRAAITGSVSCLALNRDGNLWVGGAFAVDGTGITNLILIDLATPAAVAVSPQLQFFPFSRISAFAPVEDGSLIFAVSGTGLASSTNRLHRVLPDGNLDSQFTSPLRTSGGINPAETVSSIVPDPYGRFLLYGPNSMYQPGRSPLRIFSNGEPDPEYPGFFALVGPDGRIWGRNSAGRFVSWAMDGTDERIFSNTSFSFGPRQLLFRPTGHIVAIGGTIGAAAVNNFVQFLPNGEIDSEFRGNGLTGAGGTAIRAAVLLPDGSIILGGTFTSLQGRPANRIARMLPDGTLDAAFPSVPGADHQVDALVYDHRGALWIGGSFTNFNGELSPGLAVLPMTLSEAPSEVGFVVSRAGVIESAAHRSIEVARFGNPASAASVMVRSEPGSPELLPEQIVSWSAGDTLPKTVTWPLHFSDPNRTGDRLLAIELADPSGAAIVPSRRRCEIIIEDDETGLIAEYYNLVSVSGSSQLAGDSLFGPLVKTTRHGIVRFNWDEARPSREVNPEFSVVWRGSFIPDQTGLHTFRTDADDGVRLWVDGRLILNDWTSHPPTRKTAEPIHLEAGTDYAIELHFTDVLLQAVAVLSLQEYPLQRRHLIASDNFLQRIPPQILFASPTGYAGLGITRRVAYVEAAGSPPISVQWHFNGDPIPWATNQALVLSNITAAVAGEYTWVLSNPWGVVSNTVQVVTGNPARLSSAPSALVLLTNQPVTLSAAATGDEEVVFRWYKDGLPIDPPGPSLTLAGLPSDAGLYRVQASNLFGVSQRSFRVYVLETEPRPAQIGITGSHGNEQLRLTSDSRLRFQLQSSLDLKTWRAELNRVTLNGEYTAPLREIRPGEHAVFFQAVLAD